MKSVEQVLRGLEEDMRRPENRVPEAMSRMLAPEFVEGGERGHRTKRREHFQPGGNRNTAFVGLFGQV